MCYTIVIMYVFPSDYTYAELDEIDLNFKATGLILKSAICKDSQFWGNIQKVARNKKSSLFFT